MLGNTELVDLLLHAHSDSPGISSGLKRTLVSKHDVAPVAAAQCILVILESSTRGHYYAEIFLQEDIAGIV